MKRLILIALLSLAAVMPAVSHAQASPSASQHAKLMKQRKRVVDLQLKISKLQAESAFEAASFQKLCRKVIADNQWAPDTQCDLATVTFYEKPAAKPQAPYVAPETPKPAQPAKPEPAKDSSGAN